MIILQPIHPVDVHAVTLNLRTAPSSIEQSLQDDIDQAWEQELIAAKQTHKQLFDSPVLSFLNYSESQSDNTTYITLEATPIPFRNRFIAKKYPEIGKAAGNMKAMFTHALLRTSDNHYIFGKKSDHFVTDLAYTFIGGAFSQEESLSAHIYQELQEELCLTVKDTERAEVIGMYQNKIGNIGIVLHFNLVLNAEEVRQRFDHLQTSQKKPELSSIEFVDASALPDYLHAHFSNYPDVTLLIQNSGKL